MIGCIYRSPSGDNLRSTRLLSDLLRNVRDSNPTHLLIAGDFNIPNIDWNSNFSAAGEGHHSHVLLEAIADCFLFQHVHQPSRYRHGDSPHILDLVLSDEVSLVQNMTYLPGLGNSDHVTLRFKLACYACKTESFVRKYNYWRADYAELNRLISTEDWGIMNGLNVDESYSFFKAVLEKHIKQCVPLTKAKPRKKNLYMTSQALNLKKN